MEGGLCLTKSLHPWGMSLLSYRKAPSLQPLSSFVDYVNNIIKKYIIQLKNLIQYLFRLVGMRRDIGVFKG